MEQKVPRLSETPNEDKVEKIKFGVNELGELWFDHQTGINAEDNYNHFSSLHIFYADPEKERVKWVKIIAWDGVETLLTPDEYLEQTDLPMIEGRIRTLGIRSVFQDEDGFVFYLDHAFHKGKVYSSASRTDMVNEYTNVLTRQYEEIEQAHKDARETEKWVKEEKLKKFLDKQ